MIGLKATKPSKIALKADLKTIFISFKGSKVIKNADYTRKNKVFIDWA